MDNRLTNNTRDSRDTRRIIQLAARAAQRDGVPAFGADYVLVGIVRFGESSVAAQVLKSLHVPLSEIRQRFETDQPESRGETATLTDEFLEAVRNAVEQLKHDYIGSEHLLLAILKDQTSNATQYLARLGITYELALKELMARLQAGDLMDESSFVLGRDEVRQIDRRAVEEFGMTGLVLMENAGRGVADKLCSLGIRGSVIVCCGPGNNGGDGFVIARHLEARDFNVQVLLWATSDQLRGDAATNYEILKRAGTPVRTMTSAAGLAELLTGSAAAWIVDALLGTGSRGEPRSPLDEVIDALNASGVPILAVDVPSGLDCDTGQASAHTIRAAHTCTFVAYKPGFEVFGADRFTGEVDVVDIGVPLKLLAGMREKGSGAGGQGSATKNVG